MSFIRMKRVKGHEYYYLVENKRYGKKVVQTILVYYGKNPPTEAKLEQKSKSLNLETFFTPFLKQFLLREVRLENYFNENKLTHFPLKNSNKLVLK